MREATLRLVRQLDPDLGGRRLANPSITYAGEAIALALPAGLPTMRRFGPHQPIPPKEGWLSQDLWSLKFVYPEEGGAGSYAGDVLIWQSNDIREVPVSESPLLPMIQPLPNGEIVIASSRGTNEHVNGHIYSADGRLLRSFYLGDAIEHMYTSADGSIWVAYFDEGALGKLGSSGLNRFDDRGNKLWGFNENRGSAPDIYDCYALNVAPSAIWLSAYTEFDIVRIRPDGVTAWTHPLTGLRALAVDEPFILLFGGYRDEQTKCWLGRLGENQIQELEDLTLRLPDGRALSDMRHEFRDRSAYTVVGRHRSLHVFAEDCWYRLDVQDTGRHQ